MAYTLRSCIAMGTVRRVIARLGERVKPLGSSASFLLFGNIGSKNNALGIFKILLF